MEAHLRQYGGEKVKTLKTFPLFWTDVLKFLFI